MIRGVESGIASSVCLLGVASVHGDDALGWTLLRDWPTPTAENHSLRPGVTVHLLRNPLQILDHLEPDTHAVIVDACLAATNSTTSGTPREALVLSWPDPAFAALDASLSHGLDVAAVLKLAEALGRRPRSLRLFAVEVEADACEPGKPLSPALENQLPALRRQLANLVDDLLAQKQPYPQPTGA